MRNAILFNYQVKLQKIRQLMLTINRSLSTTARSQRDATILLVVATRAQM